MAWVEEIMHLPALASTQPQAVCAAFIHRLSSYWAYMSRTTLIFRTSRNGHPPTLIFISLEEKFVL